VIPWEGALFAYIPIAALLMLDPNNARGFSLAILLGMLFLPAGARVELPGVPDLDKELAPLIGTFIGTVLFHPKIFDRYKFSLSDFMLLAVMACLFTTSLMNGFGIYDGISFANDFFLVFVLAVFLGRIHLGTPASIRTFLLLFVAASVLYAPLAAIEFRLSPQFHTTVYGYFQHVFQQHARGGFWRPILFFSHALTLARFFAFASFLALFPLREDLRRYVGRAGNYLFIPPLLALLLSQSAGPYMLFVLLCAGYFAVRKKAWLIYILPVAAFIWLLFVFLGMRPGYGIVDTISGFNPDRAGSLQYRLDAHEEYRSVILNQAWFGHGNWGHGRIEGRATDSQALISLLGRGFLGSTFYFGWWFCALFLVMRVMLMTQGTIMCKRANAIGVLCALSLSVTVIDAGIDQSLTLLVAGLITIYQWLATKPDIPTLRENDPYYRPLPTRIREPLLVAWRKSVLQRRNMP